MAKKATKTEEQLAQVESGLGKAALFFEKNQQKIISVIGGIVVLIAIYLSYDNFIVTPNKVEASEEMFIAEFYFMNDDYEKALNGDGQYDGFLIIADDYSSTPSGNLANYYAAICQINLGDYEEAISSLNNFSTDDEILTSLSIGLEGDANYELGNIDEAMSYYKDAATEYVNNFTTPYFMMKQANIYIENEDHSSALEIYKYIKSDFPDSKEASTIDKYIASISNK